MNTCKYTYIFASLHTYISERNGHVCSGNAAGRRPHQRIWKHTFTYTSAHTYKFIYTYTCIHTYISERHGCARSGNAAGIRPHQRIWKNTYTYTYTHTSQYTYIYTYMYTYISKRNGCACTRTKEPYKTDYILQKRPIILRSLLIVATPQWRCYGVATISRLLKIIGLFCKRAL